MNRHFYVIGQPGLEEELQKEILEIWPYLLETDARPNATPVIFLKQEIGGWLIEAPLILGLQLNYFSHLASRVLLRLDEFKVRDFPKLHDRLRKLPIDSYFSKLEFRVEVAAAKSRLNNEKRILELATRVWPKIKEDASAAVMIRMYDDICTVSVDTSGAHLHRRELSENKWIGEAPIRETLAAFCWRKLMDDTSLASLQNLTLWDPMAGSGTMLEEVTQMFQGNFSRDFSFQKFALTPKLLKLEGLASNYPAFSSSLKAIWASDNDPKMISVLKKNLQTVRAQPLAEARVFSHDVFTEPRNAMLAGERSAMLAGVEKMWLITNPPYGERLAFPEGFEKLGQSFAQMAANFPIERIGLILPKGSLRDFHQGLSSRGEWKLRSQSFFKNGGIPVEFSVFDIKKVL